MRHRPPIILGNMSAPVASPLPWGLGRSRMGDIADDLIEGASCAECSTYFVTERHEAGATHGYPVICRDCWTQASQPQRVAWRGQGYQRAIFKAT